MACFSLQVNPQTIDMPVSVSIVFCLAGLSLLSPRWYVFVSAIAGSILISKIEYWITGSVSESGLLRNLSTNLVGLVLVFAGVLWNKQVTFHRVMIPYLLLVGLSIIGIPFAISYVEALRFVSVLTIPILVYAVSSLYFKRKDYIACFRLLLAIGFVQIVVGFGEFLIDPEIRVSGLHDVSAVYGWFLVIVLVFSVLLQRIRQISTPTLVTLLVLISLAMPLTGARIALLLFPLAVYFMMSESQVRRRAKIVVVAVGIVLAGIVLQAQIERGVARFGFSFEDDMVSTEGEAGGTVAWRLLLWERLLTAWTENPILGFGPGADYAVSYEGGLTADLNYLQTRQLNTHNEYVKLLFNHGIAGLVLFLIFAYKVITLMKHVATEEQRLVARGLKFLMISWLLFSLTDNGLSYHGQTSLIFFGLSFFNHLLKPESVPVHGHQGIVTPEIS